MKIRDQLRTISVCPLIDIKDGTVSEYYTGTMFDVYYNKVTHKKYRRGNCTLYTDEYNQLSSKYRPHDECPEIIEDDPHCNEIWKRSYNRINFDMNDNHLLNAWFSRELMSKK